LNHQVHPAKILRAPDVGNPGRQRDRAPRPGGCPVDDDDLRRTRFGQCQHDCPTCAACADHPATQTGGIETRTLSQVVEQAISVTALRTNG
jgi:hypothetical protein